MGKSDGERIREQLSEPVSKVLSTLQIENSPNAVAKASVSMLTHMIDSYEPTQLRARETLDTLRSRSQSPERFDSLVSSLRARHAPELDRFLNTLSRIVVDSSIAPHLLTPSQPPASPKQHDHRSFSRGSPATPSATAASPNPVASSRSPSRARALHSPSPSAQQQHYAATTTTTAADAVQTGNEAAHVNVNERGASKAASPLHAAEQSVSTVRAASEADTSFASSQKEESVQATQPTSAKQSAAASSSSARGPLERDGFDAAVAADAADAAISQESHGSTAPPTGSAASPHATKVKERNDASPSTVRKPASSQLMKQDEQAQHAHSGVHKKQKRPQLHSPHEQQQSAEVHRAPRSLDFSSGQKNAATSTRPFWAVDREYLTGASLRQIAKPYERIVIEEDQSAIDQLDVDEQEEQVLDDLLYAMQGVAGTYVRALSAKETLAGVRFRADDHLDPSLHHSLSNILPLCDQAFAINEFAENWNDSSSRGFCAQAFASALKDVMSEWYTLGAKLQKLWEDKRITLQSAWYYFQPITRPLDALHSLCCRLSVREANYNAPCTGAELINYVYESLLHNSGDSRVHGLLQRLLKHASRPYMHALYTWLSSGHVDDKHGEFMIVHNPQKAMDEEARATSLGTNDRRTTWTNMYTIREPVPSFLSTEVAEKALAAGKYLNVLLTCKGTKPKDVDTALPSGTDAVDVDAYEHTRRIETCYSAASRELVRLLWHDHDLMGHLYSLKRFFLMEQGDHILHFVDIATPELSKSPDDVSVPKLRSLLGLAIRASASAADAHADAVDCTTLRSIYDQFTVDHELLRSTTESGDVQKLQHLLPKRLWSEKPSETLTGFDVLQLEYKVDWPVSIVLSREVLADVKLVSRYMLQSKRVEQRAYITWQRLASARSSSSSQLRPNAMKAFVLCQQLIHMWQSLLHFLFDEAVAPVWQRLQEQLRKAGSIDDFMKYTHEATSEMLRLGQLHWDVTIRLLADLREQSFGACEVCDQISDELDDERALASTLSSYEHTISKELKSLVDVLQERVKEEPAAHSLLLRLSFNGFYIASIDDI